MDLKYFPNLDVKEHCRARISRLSVGYSINDRLRVKSPLKCHDSFQFYINGDIYPPEWLLTLPPLGGSNLLRTSNINILQCINDLPQWSQSLLIESPILGSPVILVFQSSTSVRNPRNDLVAGPRKSKKVTSMAFRIPRKTNLLSWGFSFSR